MPGEKLRISPVHVAASVGGTVAVSFIMSFLGNAGTLAGLVVGSMLSTTFPTVLEHFGAKGSSAVTRRYKQLRARDIPAQTAMIMARREEADRHRRLFRWQPLALTGGLVLILGAGAITVAEASAGKPVSDIVQGKPGHGYTFHTDPVYTPPPTPTAPLTTIPASSTPAPSSTTPSPSPDVSPDGTPPPVLPSPDTSPSPGTSSPAGSTTPMQTPSATTSGVIP